MLKSRVGIFFLYERALTKFTVLALPAIGTFTRVGPVGVEANTASLTRKIDTFVDICEKTPYILTIFILRWNIFICSKKGSI